jgi:hypothetical protein
VNLTLNGGTSITVTGTHLPADGYRRAYWFLARDSLGVLGPWNTPRYVRVDRYAPEVSATNASDQWFPSRTATLSASDTAGGAGSNSGLLAVRYSWNTALNAGCTTGTTATSGETLTAPAGDNVLYLCAIDNTGRVGSWSGRYRVGTAPVALTTTASPGQSPYGTTITWTATASGGDAATRQFALFRRRPGGAWNPGLSSPAWQAGNNLSWTPTSDHLGAWVIAVWVKDGNTPPDANTYGYAAAYYPGTVEVVEPQNTQKPVLTKITPDSFHNGGRVRVTVQGSFLSRATVSIAEEQTDPDDPVFRVFPTAQVVSINPEGTSMEVDIDATDTRILDFHNLVVDNGAGSEAIQFRVLPGGPLVDAWTPSEPHALSIAGRNLAGTTITPSVGGRVLLHSVETSDTEITALLEVLPNAPTGPMVLIVSDGQGRTVEVPISIVLPQQSQLASRNLTESKDGEKVVAGSSRRPSIWFQEFTIRDPDKTEVLPEGLRIQGIDREAYLAKRSQKSIPFQLYIRVIIPLVRVQWQKVILFDPLTGAIGDAVLQGLNVGTGVPIGAFVISAYFQMDLTIYFQLTNTGYTSPRFCIEITYGIEITGFDGFAYHQSFCVGGGWHAYGTGSVSDGEITGGECASVTPTRFEEGIVEGIVEQNACCSQPIGVSMSGHTFTGLSWGRSFNINNPQAGTTTTNQASCSCPCMVSMAPYFVMEPGDTRNAALTIKNLSNTNCTYNYTLRKSNGQLGVAFNQASGAVTVPANSQTDIMPQVTFATGQPAQDEADLVAELTHTDGSGSHLACSANSFVCVIPSAEQSEFQDWEPDSNTDVARFVGYVEPPGTNFNGRLVHEADAGATIDHCHYPGSPIPNLADTGAITGGEWEVLINNRYGYDSIGWYRNIDWDYTQLGRTPCFQRATQRMLMVCRGQAAEYARNDFLLSIFPTGPKSGTLITRDDDTTDEPH